MKLQVVTTQYPLQVLPNWDAYADKTTELIKQAKNANADLLLLPEYAGVELAYLQQGTTFTRWQALQLFLPKYLQLFQELAQHFSLYIQAGTIPVATEIPNKFYNRAYFFSPNGRYDYQDKVSLTKSEQDLDFLLAGKEVRLFDSQYGRIGIAICYDSEFPALVNLLTHQGAKIILVPSYTDSEHGFYRVHLACRARALENQCYVVHACARGLIPNCDFLDATALGQAGIFTPVDNDFPENGILALATPAHSTLLGATLNLNLIEEVRCSGQVANFVDSQLFNARLTSLTTQKGNAMKNLKENDIRMLIANYYRAFNKWNLEAFADLLADDVIHDINQGKTEVGKAAFMKFMAHMGECYQEKVNDLIITVSEDGKHAAAKFNVHGTYLKTDGNLPPAKQQIYQLPVGCFFEIRDDKKISRVTAYYNLNAWLAQVIKNSAAALSNHTELDSLNSEQEIAAPL